MQIIGGLDFRGGGPAYVVILLNKGLNKKGVESIVFTTDAAYQKKLNVPLNEPIYYYGSKVMFSHYSDNAIVRKFPKVYYTGLFGIQFYLNLYKNIRYYDVVHIHGFFSLINVIATLISRYYKKPYIISAHGSLLKKELNKKSRFIKDIFLILQGKKILHNAKFIHASTLAEKMSLEKLGICKDSIRVILNGIDPADFVNVPSRELLFQKFPNLENKKLILFLGRINWIKGLDDLIPAFSDVVKKVNNVHLILAGPDTESYMFHVKKWINKYKLNDKISYVGAVYGQHKLMFLQGSDIFVLPSYSESFGISVIEAMYMKLPVIVTNNIGISDVIRNSQCGIVVNKNRNEINDAIIYLLKNKNMAIEMGSRGRKCVEDNFLMNKITKQLIEVYEKAHEVKNK